MALCFAACGGATEPAGDPNAVGTGKLEETAG